MADFTKAVNALLAKGATKSVVDVKNINVTEKDDYTMVSFTLKEDVDGYVKDDDGNYIKGKTPYIYTSLYSIAACVAEMEGIGWLRSVMHHGTPELIKLLLNKSSLVIIQESVLANTEWRNVFSSSDSTTMFDHDTIINHVIGIKLSKFGEGIAAKLQDKILDSALKAI